MIKLVLAVAAGGALGSVLRFLTSATVVAHWPRHFYLRPCWSILLAVF